MIAALAAMFSIQSDHLPLYTEGRDASATLTWNGMRKVAPSRRPQRGDDPMLEPIGDADLKLMLDQVKIKKIYGQWTLDAKHPVASMSVGNFELWGNNCVRVEGRKLVFGPRGWVAAKFEHPSYANPQFLVVCTITGVAAVDKTAQVGAGDMIWNGEGWGKGYPLRPGHYVAHFNSERWVAAGCWFTNFEGQVTVSRIDIYETKR